MVLSPLAMSLSKDDRRSRQRIPASVPVSIKTPQGNLQITGQTRDLSVSGIFLYTSSHISEGSDLEMVLMLPPELTQGEKRWVCCQARVVRVEEKANGNFGVAASIQNMDVLPKIGSAKYPPPPGWIAPKMVQSRGVPLPRMTSPLATRNAEKLEFFYTHASELVQ